MHNVHRCQTVPICELDVQNMAQKDIRHEHKEYAAKTQKEIDTQES